MVLSWAVLLGFALRNAPDTTKTMLSNFSDAVSQMARWVINFAPLGIMGLVFDSIATNGIGTLLICGQLLAVLIILHSKLKRLKERLKPIFQSFLQF